MKTITTDGRILQTKHKSTSYSGNPKYKVWFEDAEGNEIFATTANDAACAYGINNSYFRTFAHITYHITRSGNVIIDFIRSKEETKKIE